jgi:hypothetical protein
VALLCALKAATAPATAAALWAAAEAMRATAAGLLRSSSVDSVRLNASKLVEQTALLFTADTAPQLPGGERQESSRRGLPRDASPLRGAGRMVPRRQSAALRPTFALVD